MRSTMLAGVGAVALAALFSGLSFQAVQAQPTAAAPAPPGNGRPTIAAWVFKPK